MTQYGYQFIEEVDGFAAIELTSEPVAQFMTSDEKARALGAQYAQDAVEEWQSQILEAQVTSKRPDADPAEIAEFLIDRDPYGDLRINGLLVEYYRESGNRITPAAREKAVSLYHSWQGEEELAAQKGLSLYYPRPTL